MTNFLTHFSGRIVAHGSHRADRIYAGMVQWLYLKNLLALSHLSRSWVQFLVRSINFCYILAILLYLLIHKVR